MLHRVSLRATTRANRNATNKSADRDTWAHCRFNADGYSHTDSRANGDDRPCCDDRALTDSRQHSYPVRTDGDADTRANASGRTYFHSATNSDADCDGRSSSDYHRDTRTTPY